MNFHDKSLSEILTNFNVDKNYGLNSISAQNRLKKYGENRLSKSKKPNIFVKIINILKEPMLIILCFSFIITLGTSIGQYLKLGTPDFSECFGILGAILLSVFITLIMEGSSEKAFNALGKIYDNTPVKVIREGVVVLTNSNLITVGDVLLIESGDKITADGRLLESNTLSVDESALTGESKASEKIADAVLPVNTPLAERKNLVYSGTFVTEGNAKMLVTAVGDDTEIGKIAVELKEKKQMPSPLEHKLAKLGKTITMLGASISVFVFVVSIIRLAFAGGLDFNTAQELLISSIILIVAAVPEGLPTIVAVSLALNMIKLAKENALIRKMIASETAGAVSVICSDKTGTLTQNKMRVEKVCSFSDCITPDENLNEYLLENFICNSTAKISVKKGKRTYYGNGTERALLECLYERGKDKVIATYKKNFAVLERQPFSSDKKYMLTTVKTATGNRTLLKGAPEKVIEKCNLTSAQKTKIFSDISALQKKARRIICFAHKDGVEFVFDGYASIVDPVRKEVKKAVEDCSRAGIKVKMLTGDNLLTAYAVATELNIVSSEREVVTASDIEKLSDEAFKKALTKIKVIARSTPSLKLRVVKALKQMGEVVAVTGDGINDAPAIKHADVGIAMGKSGSEITKEASDIVLLDDSFSTVVKAISFGRNVYKNLQRFILFQLSVNLSALLFITVTVILGLKTPFNTFQLLWINVIMDGPPALTLGLEKASGLMEGNPVRREDSIVSKSMLVRIIFNGLFIGGVMVAQRLTNFLAVPIMEKESVVFSLFIIFQLFNAFNCRELGLKSILNGFNKNKIMAVTFLGVFVVHFIMVQYFYKVFGVNPMSALSWIKVILTALSIVVISEISKIAYKKLARFKVFGVTNRKKVLALVNKK